MASLLPAWARLGPLGTKRQGTAASYGRLVATVSAATAHPTGWHGGFPTGRPWGFACRTNLSVRATFPGPVPRIARTSSVVTNGLLRGWVRRTGNRRSLTSRADASLAATLTRLASFDVLPTSISSGWPRRWPPTPAVPAIGCFARPNAFAGAGLRVRSLFRFRRSVSRSTTEGNIRAAREFSEPFRLVQFQLSTGLRNRWRWQG